jgi:hypothetical protein
VHDLVRIPRTRLNLKERFKVGRGQVDLLGQLSGRRLDRRLTGVEQAGRDLPQPAADRVPVLVEQEDAAAPGWRRQSRIAVPPSGIVTSSETTVNNPPVKRSCRARTAYSWVTRCWRRGRR